MFVSDIVKRVQRKFGDETGIQITRDDIVRWINDGVSDIVVASNLLQARAVANSIKGQSEYSIPDDLLTLHSVRYNGVILKGISLEEADILTPNYDDPNVSSSPLGTPTMWWSWANQILLYPTPDADGASNLRIYYTKKPATIANDSDEIPLPTMFHTALVAYVEQQAYEQDENWSAANIKGQQFTSKVSTLQEDTQFNDHEAYPNITVSARDGWDC